MKIVVISSGNIKKVNYRNAIILVYNCSISDDGYRTYFDGIYVDEEGVMTNLGTVKIAKSKMHNWEKPFNYIPREFDKPLPVGYFSLWQSADSYQLVRELEERLNENIFEKLRDIAYDLDLLNRYADESVMKLSLLRSVKRFTCEKQFHRITQGEAKLTPYRFDYIIHYDDLFSNLKLSFKVIPESFPPTNVHVLIGRNGIGKTRLIKHMIGNICGGKSQKESFVYSDEEIFENSEHFEGVICVAFSPFDNYSELDKYKKTSIKCNYIGVEKKDNYTEYKENSLLNNIKKQFIESFKNCKVNGTKRNDWNETIKILGSDPIFASYNIDKYMFDEENNDYINIKLVETLFENLSSGHKFVLSIITCCIDKLAEKTILFIDEPENHLHPPLIASMIRSISVLLKKRNSVAVISTHSPIVLQEVPKSCVWILNRVGEFLQGYRPSIETFGTNVGSLINEVFGYEVKESGFYRMIKDIVKQKATYEEVLKQFKYQLGDEAKSLVRILFTQKEQKEV